MPPITGTKAVAAPGGCKQRSKSIAQILTLTASAQANQKGETYNAQLIPTKEDIECPQKNDQGCAKGLSGAKSKITTDAPIEASKMGELEEK